MNTRFAKYQALGNDYIVIDPRGGSPLPSPEEARRICDRRRGLGSDGILFGPVAAADGLRSVIIINPDGSLAEKSGNGARIFARYLRDSGAEPDRRFRFRTEGGPIEAEILDEKGDSIRLDMGMPRFPLGREPFDLEAAGFSFRAIAVDMCNPHCVVLASGHPSLAELRALAEGHGAAIETHPRFPARTNVQFARVAADALSADGTVVLAAVWERGAGMTEASGSSACAVAAAFRLLGQAGDSVGVRMPGGELLVEFAADGNALLSGPVRKVAEGDIDPSVLEGDGE